MSDPHRPDPHRDPLNPAGEPHSPYDPAADPRAVNHTVVESRGSGGLIAAAVIAVLLVIGVIYMTATPGTDPGTTATIPDEPVLEETAPGAAPMEPADEPAMDAAPLEEPATPTVPEEDTPAVE